MSIVTRLRAVEPDGLAERLRLGFFRTFIPLLILGVAISEWAVIAWPYKLLVRPADNLTELYDLAADPDEHDDLAGRDPARVKELRGCYGWFPEVPMDRTLAGRRWRERQAQRPRARSPR